MSTSRSGTSVHGGLLLEIVAQHFGLTVKARLRARLIGHLIEPGLAYTVGSRTGNVQAILVDGVEGLEDY